MKYILLYLLIINVLTFLIFGVDKLLAKLQKYRISESTLLFLSVVGGSIAGILAMKFFHHKTRKKKFRYGLPVILMAQILVVIYLENYLK